MKLEIFNTNSQEETRKLGKKIGAKLKAGDVIALIGDLGSGKTTFVQGLAKGLGVNELVKSPSFTIVNEYKGRMPLYHIDIYRLGSVSELTEAGIEDFFYTDVVTVVEWAEKGLPLLPPEYILIKFYYTGENSRQIEITKAVSGEQ
ncbi:MAG: tRNA (adenosine(37)-N6)-threonylcarbamoyltransferase complex ATPase subunit type 1 TsaE [Deltaproteobacteria bacterium]|nr:tRNA (adenosine(37)-N6)-threonylcarbamoyltransferase complex ATPase subunit type 1 TsaE [Deltaproteobacteria bacterium]